MTGLANVIEFVMTSARVVVANWGTVVVGLFLGVGLFLLVSQSLARRQVRPRMRKVRRSWEYPVGWRDHGWSHDSETWRG